MLGYSRFQLVSNPQKKCNCCFQWCDVKPDLSASFFSCDSCIQKLLTNGISAQSSDGSSFRLILLQGKQWDDVCHPTSCSLDYEANQRPHDIHLGWSKVHSGQYDQEFTQEEFSSSIQHQTDQKESVHQSQVESFKNKRENLLILINDLKDNGNSTVLDIPSLDLPSFQESQGRAYLSGIYSNQDIRNRHNTRQQNLSRHSNLQDYSRNLEATRILKGYQYYFNMSEIKRHKQNKRQDKARQFGDQISPCKLSQFYSKDTSAKKAQCLRLKFNKSILSQNSSDGLSRLSEDELKARILNFLEAKGHSSTMNRFMSRYVREAYVRTNIYGKTIELISFKITHMDLLCYLSLFDFDLANTLKLINVGLTDSQIPVLAEFVSNKPIQRLVLTGNTFTENTVSAFLARPFPYLKELYLGKNRINKYRVKENIVELKNRFVLYI